MNLSRLLYNVAMLPVVTALAPFAYLTYRLLPVDKAERWRQRLGYHSPAVRGHRLPRPLVWIHAVSVGEVGVALALIDALDQVRKGLGVILSTTTSQGQELAQSKLGSRASCIYFPLDLISSVHRALRHIRPDLIVCLETELWPNFLAEAHRQEIPTLLLNGRISEGSFRHYRRFQPLMAPLLQGFAALAMVSIEDGKRIVDIGAQASKVVVTGNIKGAGLVEQAEAVRLDGLRQRLDLASGQPVFVAGSIRGQELIWLPEVFSQLVRERANLVGVFAPRHLNRVGRLVGWFQRQGLEFQHLSRLMDESETRRTNIIIVDGTGMLFDIYGLADLVFCGGSLVPLGGQNILEPAAWGKAVFYGPHMDNFREACQLLEEAGCGITASDRDDLFKRLRHYLDHLDELERMGSRGRAALRDRHLIALKQAELIRDILDGKKAQGTKKVASSQNSSTYGTRFKVQGTGRSSREKDA